MDRAPWRDLPDALGERNSVFRRVSRRSRRVGWRRLEHRDSLVVRGLGCPVHFALTAGQKGDAPQAEALLKDLPADVILADAADVCDRRRKRVADQGATVEVSA